jgi:uncharacterized membrane protein HdeD (DUF308 family)
MSEKTASIQNLGWSIVLSVLLIVAGILAIILPPLSSIGVAILVGWLLVLCGFAHMAYTWHISRGGGLFWGILLGLIYIGTGGYVLLHPLASLYSLTLLLAACLLLEAILEFILSFQLRPLPGSGWLLFDGIVTLILAIMIWRTLPNSAMWVLGTLVGISMLFSGIARLTISLAARRASNAVAPSAHPKANG